MEDLIIMIFQVLFEILFEILVYVPFDWLSVDITSSEAGNALVYFVMLCVGTGVGRLSLLVMRHTAIPTGAFRILNLTAAPVVSGFISEKIAEISAQENRPTVPKSHFWKAFWFTLGFVALRFAYGARS